MSEHPWMELIPAYALGTLDPEEAARLEEHLEGCDECRAELDAQRGVVEHLARTVPPRTPPDALRVRVMARAGVAGGEATGTEPTGAAAAPTPVTPIPSGRPAPILPWLAAAAMAALALGATWTWSGARSDLAQVNEQLQLTGAELESVRLELGQAQLTLAAREQLLADLAGPNLRMASLVSPDAEPSIRAFWNPDRQTALFLASNLPPPAAGRTYQLWGIPDGANPVSLGTFTTGDDGRAAVAVTAPAGADFAVSAVTDEPAGGSAQPTTTPFLVGAWSSD